MLLFNEVDNASLPPFAYQPDYALPGEWEALTARAPELAAAARYVQVGNVCTACMVPRALMSVRTADAVQEGVCGARLSGGDAAPARGRPCPWCCMWREGGGIRMGSGGGVVRAHACTLVRRRLAAVGWYCLLPGAFRCCLQHYFVKPC